MKNQPTRLRQLERRRPTHITWKDCVDFAHLDAAGVEKYKQEHPEHYAEISRWWDGVCRTQETFITAMEELTGEGVTLSEAVRIASQRSGVGNE